MKQMTKAQKYDEILQWMRYNRGCHSTRGLARLALSCWNGWDFHFGLGKCLHPLDSERMKWAKFIVDDYFANGERSGEFMWFCQNLIDEKFQSRN